jgi:hypothetical protein
MNAENQKPDFAQVRRFRPPARQGSGFGLRRRAQGIKQGLRPSSCLCFLDLTCCETPFCFLPI